jgi:hypothetical protein
MNEENHMILFLQFDLAATVAALAAMYLLFKGA